MKEIGTNKGKLFVQGKMIVLGRCWWCYHPGDISSWAHFLQVDKGHTELACRKENLFNVRPIFEIN